ncbi:ATP-binding cassette domain-containing protein [[Clostridium] fimetarium]|uniref:NitT/TauT family transport system ATP-binding protein n=1 Tax=[Clostridium] fimetarium TaxID=99656 RepID=A0A1I0RJX6_9FIRM|nr:ATP-binding cassette domain-containing protein [[Clostridium] fimetarium]SEW41236.1 NitT/TauT family transport system ATP-binding protein [[Clostridium] fimetarium]
MVDKLKNKIEIEKLCKSYGNNHVLNSISFEFEAGKISCLMGESGIGKTTLLKVLMGLEKKDSGFVRGIDEDTNISAIFQEERLCDNLTTLGNILMVCDKTISKDTIKKQLSMVLPENVALKKVSLLSGGMRQRVAIVRAMIVSSDIVLMDEPFKGLDVDTKKVVIDYIKANQRDRTVLVVTHNIDDATMLEAPICILTKQ